MSETDSKKLILQSSDNEDIPVDREVAERSVLIKNMVGDLGEEAMSEVYSHPQCQRCRPQEGHRVVQPPQDRSSSSQRRRLRLSQEVYRHRRVGPEIHASRPRDAL